MMEWSAESASANFNDQQDPPRKRQKIASPSSAHTSQTLHNATFSKKPGPNIWSNEPDFEAQMDREASSGILCFVKPSNGGFVGILKQRYTDFLVNEVDLEGNVVHLTDINIPRQKVLNKPNISSVTTPLLGEMSNDASISSVSRDVHAPVEAMTVTTDKENSTLPSPTADDKKSDTFVLSTEDASILDSYFGELVRTSIMKLYEKVVQQSHGKAGSSGSVISEPILDRELRKKVHLDMRRIFHSRLETRSDANGVIKITAAFQNTKPNKKRGRTGQKQGRDILRGKLAWEELGGEYLHFTLYKENKDTMEVMNFVSTRLKTKSKQFSFAGTKDRRAITAQRVSVFRLYAEDLIKLNPMLFGSKIGNFRYEKYRLELGDLSGNEFVITLRDCSFAGCGALTDIDRIAFANDVVGAAVESMKIHGFLNYFGLQRFGTHEIGTDEIGKKILQGDFEGAVNAILTYDEQLLATATGSAIGDKDSKSFPRDDVSRAHAIHLFKTTGKSAAALERLPRRFTAETYIIRHLNKHPRDFIGALMLLPRNLRLMYVHAYQSLVWNLVASQRWSCHGNNVMQGDLVLIDAKSIKKSTTDQDYEVDESGELIVLPAVDDAAISHDELYERARAITAEEAASGKYSIFDIVLPTPGYDIEYPQNEIGDFYRDFMMTERGGGIDPGNMRRSQKDFSLSGSYRKLMARTVGEINYEIKLYFNMEEQLVETDLDRILNSDRKSGPRGNRDRSFRSSGTTSANQKPHLDETTDSMLNKKVHTYDSSLSGSVRTASTGRKTTNSHHKNLHNYTSGNRTATRSPTPTPGMNMDQHSAWKALPAKIAEEERAEAALYAAKKAAEDGLPKSAIPQPIYKSTFIQTSADGSGRTGHREVNLLSSADTNVSSDNVVNPSAKQALSNHDTTGFDDADSFRSDNTLNTNVVKKFYSDAAVDGIAHVEGEPDDQRFDRASNHPDNIHKNNDWMANLRSNLTALQKVNDLIEKSSMEAMQVNGQSVDLKSDLETIRTLNGLMQKTGMEALQKTNHLIGREIPKVAFPVKDQQIPKEQETAISHERIDNAETIDVQDNAEFHKPAKQAKKIAVIFKFQLGSSQYATMALRELMKNGGMQYKPEFSKPLHAKP